MRERPFVVPAEGTVEYQYFVVDPGFTEDKWMTGAQVIPGAVPSSIIASCSCVRRTVKNFAASAGSRRMYQVSGPGCCRQAMADLSRRLELVFQMHYTPNGTEQSDLSKVGLLFGNESEITHEVYSEIGLEQEFEIPPHAANYSVSAAPRRMPDHGKLLAVAPHMHLRGKSFRLWSRHGDDKSVLLDVPQYDFNWQHVYEFAEPLPLDSIGQLEFSATFDNSAIEPGESRSRGTRHMGRPDLGGDGRGILRDCRPAQA